MVQHEIKRHGWVDGWDEIIYAKVGYSELA